MSKQSSIRVAMIILLLATTSGCSTYPSRFKCGDAKGLGCTMLHEVDQQIDSGQIEEAYRKSSKQCLGKKCQTQNNSTKLRLKAQDRAGTYQDQPSVNLDHDNYLPF